MRENLNDCRKILLQPIPDTFLGRKTQQLFPKEEDEESES
jgi:hypothetical protein